MNRPVINKLRRLGELYVQQYERYLPTAFDESLSLLEKMNKIIEYMNEIGVLVNGAFEQWEEIMEWIMTDGLTDAVVEQLNKWLEDGTLEGVITDALLGSRTNIVVSKDRPTEKLTKDLFWYELDIADPVDPDNPTDPDTPTNPNIPPSGEGLIVDNAIVQDDEPSVLKGLWFDEIERGE